MPIQLDEHQLNAVKHLDGPALVVAGPGSGKTTVIIERILNLIREHNVDPESILAIAFTNAAADEMKDRINKHRVGPKEPKICTLHAFGKEIITANYDHELIGFTQEPVTWDSRDIEKIIRDVRKLLNQKTRDCPVYIYKFEGRMTGRVYIGQSIDPLRREKEHRNNSSNKGLQDALELGDELFDFDPSLDKVKGDIAYRRERDWIQHYKMRSVVNLVQKMDEVARNSSDHKVDIYKLKSLKDSKAYFGYTTQLNAICEDFDIERMNTIIFDEVLYTDIPWSEASICIEKEIRKHKNWAVFNREDPVTAQYRNQLCIEIFCKHFNVPYEEVIDKPDNFENLYEKYNKLKNEDIEEVKRKIDTGLFVPEQQIEEPTLREFAKEYEKKKREAIAVDFSDMLILPANMLENDPELLHEYREKYRYVFVDEFQDISPIDFRLLKLFPDNLFAVGDDDQAIYGFRGGDSDIMQKEFGNTERIQKYEISQNYRSTSNIVMHSKALIENNNPTRISKDLRSAKTSEDEIKISSNTKNNIKEKLLDELSKILSSDFENAGILARNWKGEINTIQDILNCSEVRKLGFRIKFHKPERLNGDREDDDEISKLIMSLHNGSKVIDVLNIHNAKGREWDKVLLLVNTMYECFPDDRNDIIDERRLFYVAVTRAKHELVIFDGGNCPFVSEFQELPHSERKRQLQIFQCILLSVFRIRLDDAKEQLRKVSEQLQITLISQRQRLVEESAETLRKHYETKLEHRRKVINETNSITEKIETTLPEQLKITRTSFLPELIPVLDQLESVVNSVNESDYVNSQSHKLASIYEDLHSTQEQFQNLLKSHGIKQIETSGGVFNPIQHEEIQSRIFSNEVPKGKIIREILKGYKLDDIVIRKAQVVVSKGEKQSDWYLNFDSTQSLCLVTDDDYYFLRDISVDSENINGYDTQGLSVHIQKSDVLFIVTERNLHAVNPIQTEAYHMSRSSPISDEYLRTLSTEKGDYNIKFVIKTGYVLLGRLVSFDSEVLNVSINKKIVVIFRNRLLAILEDADIVANLEVKSTQVETPIPTIDESDSESKTHDWGKIMEAYSNGTPVNGVIIRQIKGGLRVRIGSLPGFLPASQVDLRSTNELDSLIGKTIEMKVIEFNQQQEKLILSHSALIEENRRIKFLETVEIGQIVYGKVKKITSFGAFVDLGGIDGLVHKTELSWKRINHPSEVISNGDKINVKVININREENKISLSIKQMIANPWDEIEMKYPVGSTVNGLVVNIVNYGAFVQLKEGVEGLLHVSEMLYNEDEIQEENLLNVGDEVKVVILNIDKDSMRISLSMKQTQENQLKQLLRKYPNKPK